jgi:tocopherol O-methyltransferase
MPVKIKTDHPFFHDPAKITQTVADFWDKISEGWHTIWGPHIHHGYYEHDKTLTPMEAQENLLQRLTDDLELPARAVILDVGCGMGGSSLYLAKKYNAQVVGVTLSQKQLEIATQKAQAENLSNVFFKIENALSLKSIANDSIDCVWSLESCEQFYDKNLFLQQAYRVLKPGGKLMLATWCSDREAYENAAARAYQKLCIAFDVPYMPTIQHYEILLADQRFTLQAAHDWSTHVEKSWSIGLSLTNAYSFISILKMGGVRGLRFVKQLKLMKNAFALGRVKYGVFFAVKL